MLALPELGVAVGEQQHQVVPLHAPDPLAGAGPVLAGGGLPAGVRLAGPSASVTASSASSGGAPSATTPSPSPRRTTSTAASGSVVVGSSASPVTSVGPAPRPPRLPRSSWPARSRRRRGRRPRRGSGRGRQRSTGGGASRPRYGGHQAAWRMARASSSRHRAGVAPHVGVRLRQAGHRVEVGLLDAGLGQAGRAGPAGPQLVDGAGRVVGAPSAAPRRPTAVGHGVGVEADAWARRTALARPCGMPVRPPTSWARPWWTPIAGVQQAATGEARRPRASRRAPSRSSGSSTTAGSARVDRAGAGEGDGLGLGRAVRATRPPRRSGPARSCRSRRSPGAASTAVSSGS